MRQKFNGEAEKFCLAAFVLRIIAAAPKIFIAFPWGLPFD